MKKTPRNIALTIGGLTASLAANVTHAAEFITVDGNINVAGNWDTGTLPGAGETGTVDIDSSWPATQGLNIVAITGDLIFGGGSVLTASVDIVANNPTSVTFNDVTVNVDDDIFPGGANGNFIFNEGSVTNVDDDFEANGGGTITVNGGIHTVGIDSPNEGNFGAQNNATLNFLGGTVDADLFRTTANDAGSAFGTINVGGTATLTADGISFAPAGVIDFSSDWTGSLTAPATGGWEATLLATNATLDGAPIDATVFINNFEVTNGGQTLQLIVGTRPAITVFEYDPVANTVLLTWESVVTASYVVRFSTDLDNWESDLDDGITPDMGDFTTRSYSLENTLASGQPRVYFRVEPE